MQVTKIIFLSIFLLLLFSCNSGQTIQEEAYNSEYYYDYLIDKKDGKLEAINQFITVDTIPYLNQYISFDRDGNLQKEFSHYYTLISFKDTFRVNEEISLRIELDAPKFYEGMKVVIGDYNEKYTLKAKNRCDTIIPPDGSFVVFYDFKIAIPGDTTIRGCILNYSDNADGGVWERPVYFSKTLHITH